MKNLLVVLFFATGSLSVRAEMEPPPDAVPGEPHAMQHIERVDTLHAERQAAYANDADVWVRRGVLANRRERTVVIDAEATGLGPGNPVEFVLIGSASGHDYEALAVAYPTPSDVHEALVFIGLPVGEGFNPASLRFVPKGERVHATISWTDQEGIAHSWSAEELIEDARAGNALPVEGFAFVGSLTVQAEDGPGYAADLNDPHSIISIYNEPTTVLDRPRPVAQSDVYGVLQPYPGRQPTYGEFLQVKLHPQKPAGEYRVFDLELIITGGDEDVPVRLQLHDNEGTPLHKEPRLPNVLAALNRLVEDDRTPFIRLAIGDEVALREIRDLVQLLTAFEDEEIMYLEPPVSGHLFHRAFTPQETFRERADRPSQALELALKRTKTRQLTGVVREIVDTRARREDPFTADITEFPVTTAEDLPDLLLEIGHRLPVLLVFVDGDVTYGELMAWLRPVQATHPTLFLFLD